MLLKHTINTDCHAFGAFIFIFKNKYFRFVLDHQLPTQQNAQTYSRKGGSKLHTAGVNKFERIFSE